MAEVQLINNDTLKKKIEGQINRPVVALLAVPMEAQEQRAVAALGLKEGDLISNVIGETAFGKHSVSCSVSVNPWDCSIDID